MKIEYIENLLKRWGRKAEAAEYRKLGYTITPLARLLEKPGGGNSELEYIEEAVEQYFDIDPETAQMMVDFYVRGLNKQEVGEKHGTNRNTVAKRLESAASWMAGFMAGKTLFL